MCEQNIVMFYLTRYATVIALTAIFLPPDSQNPHVWGDLFLATVGAIFWAASDHIYLPGLKTRRSSIVTVRINLLLAARAAEPEEKA